MNCTSTSTWGGFFSSWTPERRPIILVLSRFGGLSHALRVHEPRSPAAARIGCEPSRAMLRDECLEVQANVAQRWHHHYLARQHCMGGGGEGGHHDRAHPARDG